MKKVLLTALLTLLLGLASNAQAATITSTLPEFNGDRYDVGPFPMLTIGTFNFVIPDGEKIVSAKITGQWGNSVAKTTAHNIMYLKKTELADSRDFSEDPYGLSSYTPWSYEFNSEEFGILSNGSATLFSKMESKYRVRLAPTTLEITTAPVPEPSSMVLGIMGLGSMLGFRRRK